MNKLTMILTCTAAFITAAALTAHSELDNLQRLPSGAAIRCRGSVCHTAADVLPFARSRFAPPPDAGAAVDVAPPPVWEIVAQEHGCGPDAFAAIRTVAAEYPRDDVDMAALLASLARYESSYRCNARGAAGERGLVQIHPVHRKRMARMGLSFADEYDRLRFACHLITTALDNGASLYAALKPWSVRTRAMKTYRSVTE